ncbi:MAG: fibronectin type III-like domain-contianing protein [Faecalibacterium prausnitzii]
MTLTVTNTGSCAGAEVVQLYVAKPDAKVFRPVKELKGFAKVQLEAGESKTVTIPLDDKAFRYWNVKTDRWEVEGGSYQLLVGASSADIRLTAAVTVESTGAPDPYAGKNLEHYRTAQVQNVPDAEFEALLGRPMPENDGPHRPQHDAGRDGARTQSHRLAGGCRCCATVCAAAMQKGTPDLNIRVPVQYAAACAGQDDQRRHQHGHGGRHRDGAAGLLDHRPCAGDRGGREKPRAEQPHGRALEKQLKGSRL